MPPETFDEEVASCDEDATRNFCRVKYFLVQIAIVLFAYRAFISNNWYSSYD